MSFVLGFALGVLFGILLRICSCMPLDIFCLYTVISTWFIICLQYTCTLILGNGCG